MKKALLALIIVIAWIIILNIPSEPVYYERPPDPEPDLVVVVEVYLTKYGPTGNPMANGEYPHIGAVATSDRSIPFGTKILVDGEEYVVKDRTAKWVHDRQGDDY